MEQFGQDYFKRAAISTDKIIRGQTRGSAGQDTQF